MGRVLRWVLPACLLLEIFVTLQVAAWLGAGRTLALLLLGALAGIAILRREQLAILARLRYGARLREPVLPALLDGAVRATAGILLIVPGFVSDVAALVLLIPGLRRRLVRRFSAGRGHNPATPVIDGDYRRVDDPMLPEPKREAW
jgi:UPF0716 protein FxsA